MQPLQSSEQCFICSKCAYKTNKKANLKRHEATCMQSLKHKYFTCVKCTYKTNRKTNLKRHEATCMRSLKHKYYICIKCEYKSKRKTNLKRHETSCRLHTTFLSLANGHSTFNVNSRDSVINMVSQATTIKETLPLSQVASSVTENVIIREQVPEENNEVYTIDGGIIQLTRTALNDSEKDFVIIPEFETGDVKMFLYDMADLVSDVLRWHSNGFRIKVQLLACICFRHLPVNYFYKYGGMQKRLFYIPTDYVPFTDTFNEWYSNAVAGLLTNLVTLCSKVSNWKLNRIQHIELKMKRIKIKSQQDDVFHR